MSLTPSSTTAPRVRQQARDAVVLMAFSATASLAVASAFLLLTHLTRSAR